MGTIGARGQNQWYQQQRHKEAVRRKYDRIAMYNAILDAWTARDDCDWDYIADVRRRLHMAESQLKAMKPCD